MASGVKGTKGTVFNLTLPHDICERIDETAARQYVSRQDYIRRFLIENIDVINPPTDAH